MNTDKYTSIELAKFLYKTWYKWDDKMYISLENWYIISRDKYLEYMDKVSAVAFPDDFDYEKYLPAYKLSDFIDYTNKDDIEDIIITQLRSNTTNYEQ